MKKFCEMTYQKALFFCKDGLLLDKSTGTPFINFGQAMKYFNAENIIKNDYLIIVQGVLLPKAPFTIANPKSCLRQVTGTEQGHLLKAIHLVSWDSQTKYCSICGGILSAIEKAIEKKCSLCHRLFFPHTYLAVMILVYCRDELLLARSPHFTPGVYSALAGFVGVGESAEEAAIREVKEEVGLDIYNLQYFGIQTWPFPASFMIAFTAECDDKKITIDYNELEDARWFSKDNLPDLPLMPSISRSLIDTFLGYKT
ncbi:NAD(+) diphosphatase [Wolbachia endosymbiont of Ctenocephalides felis wCfeJ]|uniref:NAD(+) diphosphatase n=1 Tax=Wolbachia endosymbiont of Ctenocephalides felis wCfeJ TaxID=2732594 RepID=UPI0014463653|nr:NAD(+) diphosphatase [Wolbachia endosymbiont of Ctenocephalides felis wCfeJ]WCR57962.1 MAG: NADH pyrophosphatase [Wolbachia endosymbiont of Ctenocephalides felis wCfeJ]